MIVGNVLNSAECQPGLPGCVKDEVFGSQYYTVLVKRSYKGCAKVDSEILLSSPIDGATCGVALEAGKVYYLSVGQSDELSLF